MPHEQIGLVYLKMNKNSISQIEWIVNKSDLNWVLVTDPMLI